MRFRDLFERYDVLLTPAAPVKPYPVEMNYPTEINGRKLENYVDWIAPTFLITLMSLPAGSVPAGLTGDGCRSACRWWRRASRSRAFSRWPSSCSSSIRSAGRQS